MRSRFLVGALALAAALFASGCVGAGGDSDRPAVILYGDSLAWESRTGFDATLPGARVIHSNFPTTAICTYLDVMAGDIERYQPDAVVLEFAGNTITQCIGGITGQALIDRYTTDANAAISLFVSRGIRVYLAAPPVLAGWAFDPSSGLRAAYWSLAAIWGPPVSFIDAGRAVLDNGAYTDTLPCLPWEDASLGCVAGRIVVRNPDRVHFCPVAGFGNPCPVYNSGGWRFGNAMAAPVARDLGL